MGTMASFSSLPVEIVQEVVHYLTHDWVGLNGPAVHDDPPPQGIFRSWRKVDGASKYAPVSKTWQDAVERETFAELHLGLARLAEADAIINAVPRRQKYVRSIWLNVELPSRQTADTTEGDNQILQDTFRALLSTLRHWTPGPPVSLQLHAYALTDKARWNDAPGRSTMPQPSQHPLLELLDYDEIMSCVPVNFVTEFGMERNRVFGRRISPASVCALLARLPACRKISLNNWWDNGDDNADVRNAFGKAVRNITHPIDYFHIAGSYSDDVDLRPTQQPETGHDKLSESLGLLSLRVQKLDLYIMVVSDDLFLQHPSSSQSPSPPAHWERLEHLALCYPPVTPAGTRLFAADSSVTQSFLQRRYLAGAHAALEMPLLKSMTLVADLKAGEEWHKFCYLCGPKKRRKTAAVKKIATAIWTSSSGFVPDDEVLDAWKAVPRKNIMNTELVVQVLDDEYAI